MRDPGTQLRPTAPRHRLPNAPLAAGLALSCALLAGAAAAAPQTAVQWSGAPGQPGPITAHPLAGGAPGMPLPGFAQAELLDLDFAGRTRFERFLPDRPRREVEAPGVAKLVLPQGRGSLFRYRREAPEGTFYGFLHVDPSGAAAAVLERAAAAGLDPFADLVAVDPAGARLLTATTVAAGGDLLEVELDSGAIHDRTGALAPVAFRPEGLGYGAGFLVAVDGSAVWRCALGPGAQAEALPFPPGTLDVEGGVVFSGDRSTAATLAGPNDQLRSVYTVRATGPLAASPAPPGALTGSGAGLQSGPHLALDHDGSRVAYRLRTPVSREIELAPTGPSGIAPSLLTADANFVDTLDEVGILSFVPSGDLLLSVGEADAGTPDGIDSLDVYRASFAAGTPTLVNLTLSSGATGTPFAGSSSIDPEDGLYAIPGTEALLLHDGKGDALLRVDAGGTSVLRSEVKQLDEIAWTGQRFVLSTLFKGTLDHRELSRVGATGPLETLFSLPASVDLPRLVTGPAERLGARVVRPGVGELFVRLDASTGTAETLIPQTALYDTSLGFASDGTLLGSAAPALVPGLFFGWPESAPPTGYVTLPVGGVWLTPF